MEEKDKKEIEGYLNQSQDSIEQESIPGEDTSPLNQPVVDKDNEQEDIPEDTGTEEQSYQDHREFREGLEESAAEDIQGAAWEETEEEEREEPPLDAPEQEINDNPGSKETGGTESSGDGMENFEVPPGHARLMADTFLGVANNLVALGGGYFVKIRKHKEFYDFDEIIQVIDKQNERNIEKIKLDEEDRALLRPLLIAVLKKRAKELSPESLLLGAAISILIKKWKIAMECRAENAILEERILSIIKQSKENQNVAENVKQAA
jgi:hypothetical protein